MIDLPSSHIRPLALPIEAGLDLRHLFFHGGEVLLRLASVLLAVLPRLLILVLILVRILIHCLRHRSRKADGGAVGSDLFATFYIDGVVSDLGPLRKRGAVFTFFFTVLLGLVVLFSLLSLFVFLRKRGVLR